MADLGGIFRASDYLTRTDPHAVFREALSEHGLFPEQIVETKGFERFSTKNKPGEKNGYYSFQTSDTFGFGCFGDWSKDLHVNWSSVSDCEMSVSERVLFQKKSKQLAKQREEEKREKYKEAHIRAQRDLAAAMPVVSHKYLADKNVIIQPDFKANGSGELLIPVNDVDGEVMSYQRIAPDGSKKFLLGGQVSGGMYFIKGDPQTICICEGVATGLTIHQATGFSVSCAFNAGNLKIVAQSVREKHPHKIVICADNDVKTEGNPGLTKGKEAAQAVNGLCVYPVFSSGGGTDFNDLAAAQGKDEVRAQIAAVANGGPVDITRSNIIDLKECFSADPPKRRWLINGLIPAGKVGAIVGAGGTGKSNFTLLLARVMASGWTLADFETTGQHKVLIVNVEDDKDDIWRRLSAQQKQYPLKTGELYYLIQNCLIYPGVGIVKPFMRTEGNNPVFTEWAGWLDRSISNVKPDCVILDTRSRLYGLDENNNDHAAQWIGMIEGMVSKYGCTFLIIHHVSKMATGSHSQGASRGASAFVDNARFIISLAGMNESTSTKYGLVGSEWKFFSMTASKSNYAKGFKPIWFEKQDEGVPVRVDIEAMKEERIRRFLLAWFATLETCISRHDINRTDQGIEIRALAKENLGFGREELINWIDRLIEEGKLITKKVDFGGKRPKKCLSLV